MMSSLLLGAASTQHKPIQHVEDSPQELSYHFPAIVHTCAFMHEYTRVVWCSFERLDFVLFVCSRVSNVFLCQSEIHHVYFIGISTVPLCLSGKTRNNRFSVRRSSSSG